MKGFSSELDSKYIDLSGANASELERRKKSLSAYEQIVASESNDMEELSAAENQTVSRFKAGMSYSDFVTFLGTSEQPGRIQELEQLTEKPLLKKIGLKLSSLTEIDASLNASKEKIETLEKDLETKRSQVSFRNLYKAVKDLRVENSDICPACSTPLQNVVQNPYLRAEKGLEDLEHLSNLEQQLNDEKELQRYSLCKLYRLIKSTVDLEQFSYKSRINNEVPNSESEVTPEWWLALKQHSGNEVPDWEELKNILKEIEKYDSDIEKLENERDTLRIELTQLRKYREAVVRHDEARKNKNDAIEKARTAITRFEMENKELIENVESEKQIIEINKKIDKAYKEFIENLNNYRKALPAQLIADLADKVKVLYNGFNRADPTGDLLEDIRLPLASGDKIMIAFRKNPARSYDALHVLSEGHIRCLGLSTLLAKNLKQNCPFLIFDDPVNAIDDDHREGIRRTIFEDDLFANSQIILTCHGEEFFKDIQNLLGAKRSKEIKTFTFLPHSGDNCIFVNSTPRNYVVSCREHFSKGEIRVSLTQCRRAMECIANELWRFIVKYGDGNLSLKLRDPKSKPELRNLVEQLRCKVKKDNFVHSDKDMICSALDNLIGIDGQSREWRYLNKGTHEEEDRTEFNRSAIQTIIESLETLDRVLKVK